MDWGSLVHDPMFQVFGVAATLDIDTGSPHSITAIDHTSGVEVGSASGADVQTVRPVAAVRVSELDGLGLTREMLRNGTIALNGKTWVIHSTLPKPAPEGDGEMWLILKAE